MIEKVIKRSGEEEKFTPSKINGWGEWASKYLNGRVNWSEVVLKTLGSFTENKVSTADLQDRLIRTCLEERSYAYNLMAGRLYASVINKELYDDKIPTLKQLHNKLQAKGIMLDLGYSNLEYQLIEKFIKHEKNFSYTHFQLKQLLNKYSLLDATTRVRYESAQFVFMRMAMALAAEDRREVDRLDDVIAWYELLSDGKISAPTPNYTNLGTRHKGFSSCCVIKADDNLPSIAAADHAVQMMSASSAGIGTHYAIRSSGDPVRGGLIRHGGKLPYYRAQAFLAKENMQNSQRGGAINQFFSCYDPEVETLIRMQNPTTVDTVKIRESHFAIIYNTFFTKAAAKKQKVFHFNAYTAPDLYDAMFSGEEELFEELYKKYESDESFEKKYFDPRRLIVDARKEAYAAGTLYESFSTTTNKQSPFEEPIYSQNLCMETGFPTSGYKHIADLYTEDLNVPGEIGICSLAAIIVPNMRNDEEYEKACYYALKMVDNTIDLSAHPLPNVGAKMRARRNAGVGISGIATNFARAGVTFDSEEGLELAHNIAERHYYFLLKASLRLAKERGPALWMDRNKYREGWLAHEHAAPGVPSFEFKYDWESLKKEIAANGGLRHSVLVNHMPTESSSKANGFPNAVYPVREASMQKSDAENTVYWEAYDNDLIEYQSAWTIDTVDLIKYYGVIQKFTDQAISADFYKDRSKDLNISTSEMLREHVAMVKYGMKSRYYQNTKVSGVTIFDDVACESCVL